MIYVLNIIRELFISVNRSNKLLKKEIYTQTELRLHTSEAVLTDEVVRGDRSKIDLSDVQDD